MKTSLICLLLLAAVACAAPRAGEMPGEEERIDVAAVADIGVEAALAAIGGCPEGPCNGRNGEPGYIYDRCLRHEVEVDYYRHNRCYCCCDPYFDMCYPWD